MTRVSVPGLGSLLAASESVEILSCSAGRLSSKAERGTVELGPRRSNALFGRRVSLSEATGRTVAANRGRGGEEAGPEGCLECLLSGKLYVYWAMSVELRLSSMEESGCKDRPRDAGGSTERTGLTMFLLLPVGDGIIFSLLSCLPASLLKAAVSTCSDDGLVNGADRSE
jgi:hypothetical protein